MTRKQIETINRFLNPYDSKAIRTRDLCIWIESKGEVNVSSIQKKYKKNQTRVSRVLRELKDIGFLVSEKRGSNVFYSVCVDRINEITIALS